MMKKNAVAIFLFLSAIIFAQESKNIDYIRRHARLAVEEMELYHIPASITLSQGILETGGGQSRLADIANNHFGIKCKTEWTGPVISHTDDAPNECFRAYGSVQESYRDHSKFLAERPYYKDLFKLNMTDYKAWANGLKKAGYATNPKYPQLLISSIERYSLDQFDHLRPDQVENKLIELYGPSNILALSNYTIDEPEETVAIHIPYEEPETQPKKVEVESRPLSPAQRVKRHPIGVNYVIAAEGETFKSIGKLYNLRPKRLSEYNELPLNAKIRPGQPVFFDKKKNKGKVANYRVQEGDDMYLIAQKNGIKVNKLYTLNRMKPGEQPKPGTVMNLKKKKKK